MRYTPLFEVAWTKLKTFKKWGELTPGEEAKYKQHYYKDWANGRYEQNSPLLSVRMFVTADAYGKLAVDRALTHALLACGVGWNRRELEIAFKAAMLAIAMALHHSLHQSERFMYDER